MNKPNAPSPFRAPPAQRRRFAAATSATRRRRRLLCGLAIAGLAAYLLAAA